MNGSRLSWISNQTEWFIVNWMAYYQSEWQSTKMNGLISNWMTLDGKLQNEWITVKLNGLPNWMAYFRIEWLTDEWPTANGILDYAQGAWDRLWSTDPVFRGRNGLIMADELFIQLTPHCSMCRGNFSPTCRMNCLNLLYSISAATNLTSLTCFFFGNPFFFKNTEFLIEYWKIYKMYLCLKDLQTWRYNCCFRWSILLEKCIWCC